MRYLLFGLCLISLTSAQAALTFFISEEAGGNNTTGRNFAATLPGSTGWNSALTSAAAVPTTIGNTGLSSYGSGAAGGNLISFGGGLTAVISSIDYSETPTTLAAATLATDAGALLLLSGNAMQDGAPTPTGLTGGSPYFNDTGGSQSSRHGVLFEFSEGIEGFGAFFGDLESANTVGPGGFTGTDPNAPNPTADGSGRRLGEILVYDVSGNLLGTPQSILSSSGNFTVNGTAYIETDAGSATGAQTFTGAGNETTRHIGLVSSLPDIGAILFVVGDDDTTVHDLSDARGNREFISTLGFQAFTGSVPEPSRALLLLLGGSSLLLRRARKLS